MPTRKTANSPRIDFAAVAASVNLRALVEKRCGPPGPGRKYRCPWHEDTNPSLGLTPDGKHWKCWSCGARGDALDWVARDEKVSLIEAAKLIDPSLGDVGTSKRRKRSGPAPAPPPPKLAPPAVWEDPEWQEAVEAVVSRAEDGLAGNSGRDARRWLESRGIDLDTARRFRLGFIPRDGRQSRSLPVLANEEGPRGIWAPRGILIPWLAPGAVYRDDSVDPPHVGPRFVGANVRRLNVDVFEDWTSPNKCMALRGSSRGYLYPFADLLHTQGRPPALLLEGELDALIGWREAGPLAFVGTIGGAEQGPRPASLEALESCPVWMIGTDHDRAGVEAVLRWQQISARKSRRVLLPFGKDLSDFHRKGGDVRAWLQESLRDLGF